MWTHSSIFHFMKIVIAADKFKHSLSSFGVCRAISDGLLLASPNLEVTCLPLSDGGDGLAGVLAYYQPMETFSEVVSGPLGKPVSAAFLFSENEKLAIVEMAQASGLHLLQPADYNPALATTYGTGQVVKKAIEKGAQKIIIGIGGSATNDCGIGMASALGYRFLDANGKEVAPVGNNLSAIRAIDRSSLVAMRGVSFQIACDVTNPLTGERGATRTYGPQKGGTPAVIESLEQGMQQFADVVKKELGIDVTTISGGGAAGGMGAGCVAFLGAEIVRGANLVFHYSKAAEHIRTADLVITGEGKIDSQTWNGKLVDAVTKLAATCQKPVIALCGTLAASPEEIKRAGLTAAFSIVNKPMPLEEALQNAFDLLHETAHNIGALVVAGSGKAIFPEAP